MARDKKETSSGQTRVFTTSLLPVFFLMKTTFSVSFLGIFVGSLPEGRGGGCSSSEPKILCNDAVGKVDVFFWFRHNKEKKHFV